MATIANWSVVKMYFKQLPVNLNDEHVLSEVISMFKYDADWRRGWSFWLNAGELKPEWLFLWGHYLTVFQLCEQQNVSCKECFIHATEVDGVHGGLLWFKQQWTSIQFWNNMGKYFTHTKHILFLSISLVWMSLVWKQVAIR